MAKTRKTVTRRDGSKKTVPASCPKQRGQWMSKGQGKSVLRERGRGRR